MSKANRIFPRKDGTLRSKRFRVPKGGYAQLTGYDLCGVCIKINQVHFNTCQCEYSEQPFCLMGSQIGIDEHCNTAIVPMPGTYVAYVCEEEGATIDDASVYLDICEDSITNLQTVVTAAGVNNNG